MKKRSYMQQAQEPPSLTWEQVIGTWADNPQIFAEDCLGITLTNQQLDAAWLFQHMWDAKYLRTVGKMHRKYDELAHKMGISIHSGHGCFAKGTLVMRSDGTLVSVENVKPADTLMGDDGKSIRNVLELKRGREPMYQFTYMDGSRHTFNESHILCLVATNSKGKRTSGDKKTIMVREWLTWGEDKKRCHAIYRSPVEYFFRDAEVRPIPPYILGVWLGDGHSKGAAVTTEDPEIVEALSEYAAYIGCRLVDAKATNCGNAKTWRITKKTGHFGTNQNYMINALRFFRLIDNKHIPDAYLYAPLKDRLELLAGLIDTDGSYDAGSYDFIQKNETIARQTCFLARSVGCHATVKKVMKKCGNNGVVGDYFRVTIGRNTGIIPVRIERKKRKKDLPNQRTNLHFGIKSVKSLGEGDYYGFVLDGNHKFLGADFTVLRNTGKTRWIATMMLRQLRLFEDIEIRVTAPTFDQIKNNIWKEVSLLARNAKDRWIREGLVIQSDRIFFKSKPEDFITAKTVNAKASEEEQGVALAGAHRTHLLIIVDESAGVPDGVFKPLEGALTTGVAIVLLIGNPVYSRGYFARTHGVDRQFWSAVRWDDEESNMDEVVPGAALKEYCARMMRKYGRDSNTYRVRVRGLLPTADTDTLIPNDWIMDAVDKELLPYTDSPFIASVDPAAGGQNKSILTIRQGPKVFPLCEYDNNRSEDLADWIGRDLVDYKISQVLVDSIGVGWGIAGGLRRLGYRVREYKSSYAPKNESKFTSARDEDYWHLRELFENGAISIPNDDELIGQLGAIKYKPIMNKTKVESKKDMKSRGIESPDRADSLCMAFSINDAIYNHKSKEKDAYDEEEKKWGETTWAAA